MYILFFVIYLVCMIMRFIKRFIFVLVLLLIAFFVYRLISPEWARQLLYDLKLSSNSRLWTDFSLSGEVAPLSWSTLATTWPVLAEDSSVFQLDDDEELFLADESLYQESAFVDTTTSWTLSVSTETVSKDSSSSITSSSVPSEISQTPPPKKTTIVPKGLSAKDKRDLNIFLQNFGN